MSYVVYNTQIIFYGGIVCGNFVTAPQIAPLIRDAGGGRVRVWMGVRDQQCHPKGHSSFVWMGAETLVIVTLKRCSVSLIERSNTFESFNTFYGLHKEFKEFSQDFVRKLYIFCWRKIILTWQIIGASGLLRSG